MGAEVNRDILRHKLGWTRPVLGPVGVVADSDVFLRNVKGQSVTVCSYLYFPRDISHAVNHFQVGVCLKLDNFFFFLVI